METPALTERFTLWFDGPALKDHTIPVQDLAPALLAAGELVDAVNAVVHGETAQVHLRVSATGSGSFEIDLDVVLSLAQQLVALADTPEAQKILEVVGWGGGSTGVFKLLKWLNGKRPSTVEPASEGVVKMTLPNGASMEWPAHVAMAVESAAVRRSAAGVVDALNRPGIDTLRVRSGGEVIDVATKDDVPSLQASFDDEVDLGEQTFETNLTLVKVDFGGGKWRFSDGQSDFYAAMEDERYLQLVQTGQADFAKNDVLRCRVRRQQSQTSSGLSTRTAVEEVLNHHKAGRQLRLLPERKSTPAETDNDVVTRIAAEGQEFFLPFFVDVVRSHPEGIRMGPVISAIRQRLIEEFGVDIDDASLFPVRPSGQASPRQLIRNLQSNKRLEGLVRSEPDGSGKYVYYPS